jgi:hypothetical protein
MKKIIAPRARSTVLIQDFEQETIMREPSDSEIEATRKHCIRRVVETMLLENVVVAHTTVAARLEREYPDFHYVAKEDDFRSVIDDSLPPDTVAPTSGALAVVEPSDTAVVEPEPEPMDVEALREAIHAGEMARGEIRSQLFAAQGARGISRTILASALQAFVANRPILSPTQVAQSFCASAAADREVAKSVGRGGHPAHAVHHRSALDQQLAYSAGGNVDGSDAVRSRFQTGHRRGAMPQATASRINQARTLAIAAAAKAAFKQ